MYFKSFYMLLVFILIVSHCNSWTYELNDPPPICSAYEMLIVNSKQCVSRCPIRCIRGICFEDGACPCANSYMTSFEKGIVCAQTCLPGCLQAGGYCATPDLCICKHKGSIFDPIARKCKKFSFLRDKCLGRCLYGNCDFDGTCTCSPGFVYNNNLLGQLCTPVCNQDCTRKGFCFLPNMCACRKKHEHYGSDGLCHKDDDFIF